MCRFFRSLFIVAEFKPESVGETNKMAMALIKNSPDVETTGLYDNGSD